jgi:hypothetical protein
MKFKGTHYIAKTTWSWYKAPIWGLRPDLYYLYDSYGLLLVGRPL